MSGRHCTAMLSSKASARTARLLLRSADDAHLAPLHHTLGPPLRHASTSTPPARSKTAVDPALQARRAAAAATAGRRTAPNPAVNLLTSKMLDAAALSGITTPYATYGVTGTLFLHCAAAGDYGLAPPPPAPALDATYTAPGAAEGPSAPSPPPQPLKTAAGEDLCYPGGAATWHGRYGLAPTFATWAQLAMVHVWAVGCRTRMLEAETARRWTRNLLDHFFFAAEERMERMHGLTRGVRARYLKDLFEQWRGVEVSYDQGLVAGDAVLAAAVWRNVFAGREEVDGVAVAEVVAWMRKTVRDLGAMNDAQFAGGIWTFEVPWERREVERESRGIRQAVEGEAKV